MDVSTVPPVPKTSQQTSSTQSDVSLAMGYLDIAKLVPPKRRLAGRKAIQRLMQLFDKEGSKSSDFTNQS
jgi:hypothetical protein